MIRVNKVTQDFCWDTTPLIVIGIKGQFSDLRISPI